MMRVLSPAGVLREVTMVVPVCEVRVKFNGRQQRYIEIAKSMDAEPTGIAMRLDFPVECQPFNSNNQILFVGNLNPETVKSIQKDLLTQGYVDLSQLEYQKAEFVGDTCFDNGKGKAYSSDQVRDAASGLLFPFNPGYVSDIFVQSQVPASACNCPALEYEEEGDEEDY